MKGWNSQEEKNLGDRDAGILLILSSCIEEMLFREEINELN